MDAQSWGSFLLILGLVQVVLAGFFLRRDTASKTSSSSSPDGKAGGNEAVFWVWVGRLGAVLCVAGVLIIVMKS